MIVPAIMLCAFIGASPEALLRQGDAAYRRFANDSAIVCYEQANRLAPGDFPLLLRLVRVNNDQGRLYLRKDRSRSEEYYLQAVAWAESLQMKYPRRAESKVWIALARASLIPFRGVSDKIAIGREVKENITEALHIDSTLSAAHMVLGIFEREGAHLTWWERAVVRIVFGGDMEGSLEESERLLQKALVYDPANMFAWSELSRTYRAMGRIPDARKALESVVRMVPANAREVMQHADAVKSLDLLNKQPPSSR